MEKLIINNVHAKEYQELTDAYQSCKENNGLVFVSLEGDAGFGKTVLLKRFLDDLEIKEPKTVIANGIAGEMYGYSSAYQPIRDAFNSLRSVDKSRKMNKVKHAFKDNALEIAGAMPALGNFLVPFIKVLGGYSKTKANFESSTSDLIAKIISSTIKETKAPFVLALDDMQWSDESSLDAISTLAQNQNYKDLPILIILSYRNEIAQSKNNTSENKLLKILTRIERYTQIRLVELSGVDDEIINRICEASLGFSLNENELKILEKASKGNILFVTEILEYVYIQLKNERKIEEVWNDIAEGDSVVEKIKSVTKSRLLNLDSTSIRVLEICSVLGKEFLGDNVISLSDLTEFETRKSLRLLCKDHKELANKEFGEDIGYLFTNEIVYKTVKESLNSDLFDERFLKNKAANIIVESATSIDERINAAGLFEDIGQRERALEIYSEVIKTMFSIHAFHETIRLLDKMSLDELANNEELWAIYIHSLLVVAKYDKALVFWEYLKKHVFLDISIEEEYLKKNQDMFINVANCYRMKNQWDKALNHCESLTSSIINKPGQARILNIMGEIYLCGPSQNLPKAQESFEKAYKLAEDYPTIAYRSMGHIGLTALSQQDGKKAAEEILKAIDISKATGNFFDIYEAYHWLSKVYIATRKIDKAHHCLDQLDEINKKYGIALGNPYHVRDRARAYGLEGKSKEAANEFFKYLQSGGKEDEIFHDVLAITFALQVTELIISGKKPLAYELISEFNKKIDSDYSHKSRYENLLNKVNSIKTLGDIENEMKNNGFEEKLIESSKAIFAFDIKDFWDLI